MPSEKRLVVCFLLFFVIECIYALMSFYCMLVCIGVFKSFEYTHISYDIYKYIYIDAMQFALNLPP